VNKKAIIDIGELGWSLYLVAHARWLKEQGNEVLVMGLKDRHCLYEGIADKILEVPKTFFDKFGEYPQQCCGRNGCDENALVEYFARNIPRHFNLAEGFRFNCVWFFEGKTIYEPFKVDKELQGKHILVFPRFRDEYDFAFRNLPKAWWVGLVNTLCMAYADYTITAMGTKSGAYDLEEVEYKNFNNLVGKTDSVQEVINFCGVSDVAIGSASSLPKVSLLQRVPTYVVGHEKERVVKVENWLETPVGFWEIDTYGYNDFDDNMCITDICKFINENI